MSDGLKNTWKDTGVGLGHAFRDLGKTLIKTGTHGLKKAEEWANTPSETAPQTENTQPAEAVVETTAIVQPEEENN